METIFTIFCMSSYINELPVSSWSNGAPSSYKKGLEGEVMGSNMLDAYVKI